MRVLHLVHQYLPEFVGGTELHTQALTQALAPRGWEAAVFYRSYRDRAALAVDRTAAVATYAAAAGPLDPTRRFLDTWHQPALRADWLQALDDFRPDLVHVQHLMGLPASLLDELAVRAIPYLITLHDYWWVCANANLLTNATQEACAGPQACLNCTRCVVARAGTGAAWVAAPALWGMLLARRRRLRALLAGAFALVTHSEFVRGWYAAHGAPAATLRIVDWGVTPPPRLRARAAHDGLSLLYVGGLTPSKGLHTVLEALQGVTGRVELAIGGDPATDPGYVAQLRQAADHRVTWLGRLARGQVWQAMADADAVVVPSLWHETFSLVAHEALAVGTPVLASAMGALSETVQDGVNGYLLPPADVAAWRAAIQRLVDDPACRQRLRAGIGAPSHFDDYVDQVEAIYHAALATHDIYARST